MGPTIDAPAVSWWQVIVDLERERYTHVAIATAIGSARGTVEGWKNKHAQPRHEDGERLIALWCVVKGRQRADLPLRRQATRSVAQMR
ncbi:hypothetical protein BH10PSE18_BH10PSE18_08160 [soil metagenome]